MLKWFPNLTKQHLEEIYQYSIESLNVDVAELLDTKLMQV